MSEKFGVKETEDALVAIFGIIDVIAKNKGSSPFVVAGKMLPLAGEVVAAINGGDQIPNELKDLSEPELNRLYSEVSQKLEESGLNEELRGCIEADITVLTSAVVAIQRHAAYAQK